MAHILPVEPVMSLDSYIKAGGGRALETCRQLGAPDVVKLVRASGLRGRGGAGFPTGIKWSGLADAAADVKFAVCNAAEGEPGTFKDRAITRRNPYQVLEGLAAAAFVVAADSVFVGIKEKFTTAIDRLEEAAAAMSAAGMLGDIQLGFVYGPDDYLFGEEKGLLEVIEGRDPLPRLYPPYVQGLFEEPGGSPQPALVNNVETLANIPHILANGADWFRSMGTADSPGTMVCTIGGDTNTDAVAEIELGTPLVEALDAVGGGMVAGTAPRIVLNGVSNAPLTAQDLATPISFEAMKRAGSGLGTAGFTFLDQETCAVQVAAAASAFLFRGSCGQCPSCKLGTAAITESFEALSAGGGGIDEIEEIAAWTQRITDSNRCGLGAGQQALAAGVLERFPEDLAHHVDGSSCSARPVRITTIADWDISAGRFDYSLPVLDDAPGG